MVNHKFKYDFKVDQKFKQDSILELEKELTTREENNLPSDWEKYLTLDCWKNWREKIKSFQYMDEVHLYKTLFVEIRTWIADVCANPHKYKNPNIIKEVEEELSKIPIIKNDYGDDWWTFSPKDPQQLILIRRKRNILYNFIRCEKWNIPNWEIHLTLDYWKNWQAKIMAFKNLKELHLYSDRLSALRNFIENKVKGSHYANWNQARKITNITIAEEEARLAKVENEEEWKKDVAEVCSPKATWKELSVEEMINDPWISKQIDNNPNSQSKSKIDEGYNSDDEISEKELDEYKKLSREELIKEIKRLKAELAKINSCQVVVSSQTSQKLEKQLQQAQSVLSSFQTPNNSPEPTNFLPIIIVVSLASLFGGFLIVKRRNKSKKKY